MGSTEKIQIKEEGNSRLLSELAIWLSARGVLEFGGKIVAASFELATEGNAESALTLSTPTWETSMSGPLQRALNKCGIYTLGQLLRLENLRLPGVGPKRRVELERFLSQNKLTIGSTVPMSDDERESLKKVGPCELLGFDPGYSLEYQLGFSTVGEVAMCGVADFRRRHMNPQNSFSPNRMKSLEELLAETVAAMDRFGIKTLLGNPAA